jgi:hypothetical protein
MQQGAFFHRNYLLASTGITRWFHRNLNFISILKDLDRIIGDFIGREENRDEI